MKKIGLILMIIMLAGNTLAAQNRQRRTPEEMAKTRTENLVEKLDLNKVQQDSIYQIYLKSAEQTRGPRGNADGSDREQRRAQMQKAQEQLNQDVRAILTADQQKKYDELLKEMQNRRPNNGNTRGRQRGN